MVPSTARNFLNVSFCGGFIQLVGCLPLSLLLQAIQNKDRILSWKQGSVTRFALK